MVSRRELDAALLGSHALKLRRKQTLDGPYRAAHLEALGLLGHDAEASGLHTYTTIGATSLGVANRFNNEEGRTERKNSFSNVAVSLP